MILPIIILSALLTSAIFSQPPTITVKHEVPQPTSNIGHAHVFSAKHQTIHLNIAPPLKEKIQARIYRTAGSTLAAEGPAFWLPLSGQNNTPLTIDFPASEKTILYTLIIDTQPKKHLLITAHPSSLLDSLRTLAKQTPIQLFNTPLKVSKTFHQLNIPSRVLDNLDHISPGILILSDGHSNELTNITENRVIILSSKADANREIWISQKSNQWKITIPAHHLTPEYLITAAGQNTLRRITISKPN